LHERVTPASMDWIGNVLPWATDNAFKQQTRMNRRSFGLVVHILTSKCSEVFTNISYSPQEPISVQLHIFMFCLGFDGIGASFEHTHAKYGYSVGMISNARRRVSCALYSIMGEYIQWPTAERRRELCAAAREKYGFKWAFFTVDGTGHNFCYTPGFDKETFFDRKKRYRIRAMVTNDFTRRIINVVVGWPRLVHDGRVLAGVDS